MSNDEQGFWRAVVEGVPPGALYFYTINDSADRPDPASHFQPQGVHGPSAVIDHSAFEWADQDWPGIPPEQMIIYELHVGTFTPEGTFFAAISRLGDLQDLGVNAVELMPVSQFPGERNWGYDGAYPFAAQNSYGGAEGLKQFVNECHRRGVAVILDCVYNHLGPEGNYAGEYGPFYSGRYRSPWGSALNFDGPQSDGVRNHFIQNALYWFRNYHIDALRLDAVDTIIDTGAKHFLRELSEEVESVSRQTGRRRYLIAESDASNVRFIQPTDANGYGLDAQWLDDFHHSIHTLLTGELRGYYLDFGTMLHLEKCLREGFVYSWQYSAYRAKRFGSSSAGIPGGQFVVCTQNHDQVGNRMLGERLSSLVSFEALKLAAAAMLTSPYIPLLFMGEEYAEDTPFQYFVSHGDPDLVAAVRRGRAEEFAMFLHEGDLPDPQGVETFLRSKLDWDKRGRGHHKTLLDFYRLLIKLRKRIPALHELDKKNIEVSTGEAQLLAQVRRWHNNSHVYCVMCFNNRDTAFPVKIPEGRWTKILDSADHAWGGPGPTLPNRIESGEQVTARPLSFALYEMESS